MIKVNKFDIIKKSLNKKIDIDMQIYPKNCTISRESIIKMKVNKNLS